jgi:rod shape-determining protein MreC
LSFWRRNRGFITFSLALAILISFLGAYAGQRSDQSGLEGFIMRIFAPLQRWSSYIVQQIRGFGDDLAGLFSLQARNAELQARLDALEMQFNLLVEVQRENLRLKELLGYRESRPELALQLAKVIGTSTTPWHQELLIDQGSEDGVEVNMPVITHRGFVGRVYEVGPTSSKVVLITDPRGPVAAQVQETRVRGTAEADPGAPGMLRLIRLARDADVRVGHLVVTAGTGALPTPPGIVIGEITQVTPTADGLQLIATIKPAVNFSVVEEVLLVTSLGGR